MEQKIKICICSCNEFSGVISIVSAKYHFHRHGKMLIVNNIVYKRNGMEVDVFWYDGRAGIITIYEFWSKISRKKDTTPE